ncbi:MULTISPECIES: hypothetical protein [Sinorhizobium]|jgi:hypothetical protein|uniref:hypothetical protein n=1 Tax=Sinorhizobium TaxID=28105 RepID=UPI000C9A4D0D|nr:MULTISPECIES: hypothetical protein [Sinorhizobium]PND27937.1 hypothetical protein CN933_07445 [Sinorhizobium sp. M4_45]RVP97913.1 hypothetical protein CN070_21430 [Sinorhizobium meliloti]
MGTAEHTYSKTDWPAAEIPLGLRALYESRRKEEWQATVDKLDALRQSFAEQRRHIIAPELRDRIKNVARSGLRDDPRGPGLRYRSFVEARNADLDLNALKRLHKRAYGEVGALVKSPEAFHRHETVVGSVTDIFKQPPIVYVAPDPDKEKLFLPPFGGCWDRLDQNQATGDGAIVENSSYLDCAGRFGSKLIARNSDASDVDLLCAYRENGYLVPFKTLRTGILQVKADLSALICRHHISTYDEFGWSDFHATTRGRLVLAVFWNWEDVEPANEVSDQWFASGLDCSGDGESFPGTSIQAVPGERRIINLFTEMAFPAGRELWIYVGVADRIWALLNDVSIDISIDSAWQLNSLAVRSL